tara:strand:- start:60 stop:338 length:279 start_codon:yes stop_codon:yes gene_type:complete
MLECSNNSFYIGYTTDIKRRYQEHCEGSAKCKYTRSFPPQKLAACWAFDIDLGEILSLEKRLKQLTRVEKESLVEQPNSLKALTDQEFKLFI